MNSSMFELGSVASILWDSVKRHDVKVNPFAEDMVPSDPASCSCVTQGGPLLFTMATSCRSLCCTMLRGRENSLIATSGNGSISISSL